MKLLAKRLTETAKLPKKDRPEDEGWDIFADESILCDAGVVTKVSTGIACAVEDEFIQTGSQADMDDEGNVTIQGYKKKYWLQLEGRSGMAFKGIFPVGGIVDNGYTGEIGVMLANMTGGAFTVNKGDKIAQLIIREHMEPELVEVEELEESDRGSKGYGSSGT